jgi:subtilase family serine protease
LGSVALAAVVAPAFAQVRFGDREATPPIRVLVRANGTPFSATPTGITPAQMTVAYGLNLVPNQGAGQTVGIVDAYDDPNIEADLGVFSAQFGLPACTTSNGCFKKVFESGKQPRGNTGWGTEISLDVEWVHAMAPQAKIVLVEAASASNSDLFTSVDVAIANGASVVTMSFSGSESSGETAFDSHFTVPGVVFFASAGDSGNAAGYPATSPYVVGVGGTTLSAQANGTYVSESAWSCTRPINCAIAGGTGGGTSTIEPEPAFQTAVQQTGFRTVPDISLDADPNSGVPVYDTYGGGAWIQVGGTSLSSPAWAGVMAVINSSRVAAGKSVMNTTAANNVFTALYGMAADLHDVTTGTDGNCGAVCKAGPGYDELTGMGTPAANALVPAMVALP